MSALRLVARSALRSRPSVFRAAPLLRRGYADVAPDKIQLSLALPHQVRICLNWLFDKLKYIELYEITNN